jgi:exopolysaccharide biosynthesis polyprenyl glycosylphosphotransferase
MQFYLSNPYLRRVLGAVALDACCFLIAFGLAHSILGTGWGIREASLYAALGATGAFVALYYCRAYSPMALASERSHLLQIWPAMSMIFVAALAIYFVPNLPHGTTEAIPITLIFYLPFLYGARSAFRRITALPRFNERLLIVGASDVGQAIAEAILKRPNLGIHLVGFLSDSIPLADGEKEASFAGFPVLGPTHELENVFEEHRIGRIVVASKDRDEHFPSETLLRAKLNGRHVESGVSFFERVAGRIYLRDLRPSYLIFSPGFSPSRLTLFSKRAIDLIMATLGLAITAPLLAVAAIAIKLDSPGPILYTQRRLGQGGSVFDVLKFRSMVVQAEGTGPRFAERGDLRITRVGRFIRRTRIDELPQLLNVLRGEMSLVGPRPERPEIANRLSERFPFFRLRCHVKPGCTGWAQIRHGYVNEIGAFEEKMALDLYYMKYRSVTMDALILWKTFRTLFLLEGV